MSTIIQQGSFTSDGLARTIPLRSDVDWMEVINFTNFISTTADEGARYTWRRGMAAGRGLVEYHAAADDTMGASQIAAGVGFTLHDGSTSSLGASTAVTAISNATPPVAAAVSTTLIANSSIVRLYDVTGGQQLSGMDWSVGVKADNAHFALAHAPAIVAATGGTWRLVAPSNYWYPTTRQITAITQASSAVITTSVTSAYVVGQQVRITVPTAFGMIQMNNLVGTITAVDQVGTTTHNNITVNIDSSAFTAFAFPLTAASPFSPAMVTPVGVPAVDTYGSLNTDATVNNATIGMVLGGGALAPGGQTADVCYWTAGKSFNL